MSIRKIFIFSLLFSLLFNFFFYYFFESKKALGQGAYCQPLPYLNFGEPWPGSGHLVMTSSTPNVLIKYSGSGLITGTGSSGQVAFWTGSVSIGGNNNLFWDNTNKRLGISTTTPQTSLHVVGNVTADAFLGTINAANVSSGQFGANTGGGNYYFMGNVGIGTTGPIGRLGVVGGLIYAGDTNTRFGAQMSGDDAGRGVFGSNMYVAGDNTIRTFGTHASYGYSGVSFEWGNIKFYSQGGATVQDAIVNPSTRMIINTDGNVGIGTTNPEAKLHILESSSPDGLIIDSPGWPIRRIIQRGGVIVEAFVGYDTRHFFSFRDKIMRITKPTIDFTDFNPAGIADQWSLRVYGCIYIPTPGTYTFYLTTDDGAIFWVNQDYRLVNQWRDQPPTTYTVSFSFPSSGWYPITIDHYDNVGGERLLLEWSGPGISRSIISSYYLGICWPDLH